MERFCTQGSISENKALVEQLQHYGILKSKKVAEVMEIIDRGLFVPEGNPAYLDSPIPIGYNATISAPHMHATCLELLEGHLQPGMRALDVGSGSGYLTACLTMMVGPEGRAVGVEHIPELAAASIENVKRSAASHLLNEGSLSIHVAGPHGWQVHRPNRQIGDNNRGPISYLNPSPSSDLSNVGLFPLPMTLTNLSSRVMGSHAQPSNRVTPTEVITARCVRITLFKAQEKRARHAQGKPSVAASKH